MRIGLSALAATALITGCSSIPRLGPAVDVPVGVSCVRAADLPARPALHADAAWTAGADPFVRARALLVDRLLLIGHADRLEALLKACVGAP